MTDLDQSPAQPYDILTEGPTVGPVKNYNPATGGGGTPGGASGNVQYNQSGTFGGLTDAQLTAKIQAFSSSTSGAVPASGGGSTNFLRADGTFAPPTQATGVVTYSQIQNVSNSPRALGNVSGGAGPITELTGTQLATFIDLFTTGARGQVPASGGGSTNFLRADGVWVSPGSSGLPGGASGQFQFNNAGSFGGVTMSGDATWDSGTGIITVSAAAITYAKMQNISANGRVLGRISGAPAAPQELTGTQVTTILDQFTSSLQGVVPSSGGGTVNFLRADGTWVPPPGGSGGTPGGALNTIQWNSAGTFAGFAMNGDATLVPSTGVITISNQAVTYAKIQNVSATSRFLGRISGGAGSAEELTPTQATSLINVFTSSLSGAVPSSGGGTTNFLRADGTWIAPGGAGAPGGTNGQIQYNNASAFGGFTASGDATINTGSGVVTIANTAVTYAKMQNVSANNRVLGNVSGGAGPVTELTPTQLTTQVNVFTSVLSGAVPASGGGTTNFLRADGTFAAPGGAGGPGGTTGQIQFNNASAFAGMSGTSWDDTNRALTATGATVTTSKPWAWTQTWNAGAVQFNFADVNITDTASNINSTFVTYRLGGTNKFVVRKDGTVTTGIWGGTAIAAPQGGTGQTGYAIGDTLFASSTTALSKLPGNTSSSKLFLSQTGTGTASASPVWSFVTGADIGLPTSTLRGSYAAWSNTTGSIMDGQGPINALAYGADNTGVSDSKTAIQNALNTNRVVYLPRGSYLLNSGLTIPNNGGGLVGDAPGVTLLNRNFASGDLITIPQDVNYFRIENIDIGNTSGPAAISGYGINISSSGVSHSNNNFEVRNVNIDKQFIGVHVGSVSWGYMSDVNITRSVSHGVFIDGAPAQIQMTNILSENGGGNGFFCVAGVSGSAVGQWRGLATFGNAGFGFYSSGYAALRVSDSFFGGDHSAEVYVGTGGATGYEHLFTNVETELCSTSYGFFFDTGMLDGASLSNCAASSNALSGVINNSANTVQITGGFYLNNGTSAVPGNTYGILNNASGAKMSVVGVKAAVAGSQTGGIVSVSGTAACTTVGCQATISNLATLHSDTGNYT